MTYNGTSPSVNNPLPSREGWARVLNGKLSPNGKSVRFDMPEDRPGSFSKTLTLDPNAPGGYIVEDPDGKTDWREIKDYTNAMARMPSATKNSGNSRARKVRRQPAGAIVEEAPAAVGTPQPKEGAEVPSFSPPLVSDWREFLRSPAPDRSWLVPGLIPADDVTLLSGNGGEGKTYLALQLGHCLMWGGPWIGASTSGCSTIYYSCEEGTGELHYRARQIAEGVLFGDGEPAHVMKLISAADREDAVLALPDGKYKMVATPILLWFAQVAAQHKAGLLILDAAADVFGGDEINRAQVRSFIGILRGLCKRQNCAVLLLAHPSVRGLNDGSGTSGSTGWSNSVRSRIYLKAAGNEDRSVRTLSLEKANRAEPSWSRTLRWVNGSFHVENVVAGIGIEQMLKAKRVFLDLLKIANDSGRTLSDKPSSAFAPKVLQEQARAHGITKDQLASAMGALFEERRLRIDVSGPPSRLERRLVEVEAAP